MSASKCGKSAAKEAPELRTNKRPSCSRFGLEDPKPPNPGETTICCSSFPRDVFLAKIGRNRCWTLPGKKEWSEFLYHSSVFVEWKRICGWTCVNWKFTFRDSWDIVTAKLSPKFMQELRLSELKVKWIEILCQPASQKKTHTHTKKKHKNRSFHLC